MRTLVRFFGKLLAFMISIIIIIAIAAYFYIRPTEAVGWPQQIEVSLMDRVKGMVQDRAPVLHLKEEEINSLAAAYMQETEPYRSYIGEGKITGLRMRLDQDTIEASVKIEPVLMVQAVAKVTYRLEWHEDEQLIRAVPELTKIKDLTVPQDWFALKPIDIPLASELPAWVKVKSVDFGADGWKFTLGLNL